MPQRKLVQIGQPPKLPTVAEYFRDLANRQGEDIRLLKERAAELAAERQNKKKTRKSVRPDNWVLHPVRTTRKPSHPKKRSTARRRTTKRSSRS